MKCPKCQSENREGVTFCEECGSKIELQCPNCGNLIPAGKKFCGNCGHNLSEPTTPTHKELTYEEKLARIQKYLPKDLTEKILSQRGKIEGERKQVTVMFCDLEGFTPLVEKIGADEAYTIMDQVYELLIHAVHDYEGTVNEMTGDGIMALFGAPIALEDAPQRAIRSALAIHREMARFNDHLKQEKKEFLFLRMRIGIHSGPVVVGTLGNDLRVEFKAVGDTVNLASRMEHLAEPGATYITEDTFKLIEGLFRFEALGAKEIKGKEELINVYQVITTSSRRTRFDVSAERGLTALVGRERELEILLDGFEMVKSGRGQAFSVVAEAGAGKSRLLYEFRKAVASEEVTILEGKCLSFARNVAYRPINDILKANFRIEDDDEDGVIQEKIVNGLQLIKAEEASTLPYLADLLAVKESGLDQLKITPALKKDRIVESLQRIVIKGAELRPLIMIFEDLHWVDSATENLLKEILETIPGSKVLLLFSYRPEYVHTWGGKSYHSQITLNRLSNRESLSMLYHLLDSKDIERSLEELVLSKTEGIPFYLEEFVRSLKDLKIIEKREKYCLIEDIFDLAIPSSIQDVIMARVDALPKNSRELLQTGSVIEREFSFKLIKKVTDQTENDLLSNLSILKDSELIYERGLYPDTTYIFKHAIAREVVYDSILSKRRKTLHNTIGNAIEEVNQEKIEEHFEILAEHYLTGENFEKGAECAKLAARKAAKSVFWRNAAEYTQKRVNCLEKMPQTDVIRREIISANARQARLYSYLGYYSEAKEAVAPIIDQAEELNLRQHLPDIYCAFGQYYCVNAEDFEEGFQYFEKGLRIAEEEGNLLSFTNISFYFAAVLALLSVEFEKSLVYFNRALELAETRNSISELLRINASMSYFLYINQGKIDHAYQMSKAALTLALDQDDQTKEIVYSAYGIACLHKGLFDDAEAYLKKGIVLCQKSGDQNWVVPSSLALVEIYLIKREYKKAQTVFEQSILPSKHMELPTTLLYSEISLVRCRILNGQDIDIREILDRFNRIKFAVHKSRASNLISEIFLNIDDQHMSEAGEWISKAIEINTQNGTRFYLGQSHHLYSEFYQKQDNLPQAREQVNKAIDIMKECGADGWVERYEKELADLL